MYIFYFCTKFLCVNVLLDTENFLPSIVDDSGLSGVVFLSCRFVVTFKNTFIQIKLSNYHSGIGFV